MSLLSYDRLCGLVECHYIEVDPKQINGASIDITLGDTIMVECPEPARIDVDLKGKEYLDMYKVDISNGGRITLRPGDFILASSREVFNLPDWLAAEYKLKSSLARSGLQHMLAGWCDPGWTNSKLTLELKNVTQHHNLILTEGMKIGQMVFWETDCVPAERSYVKVGQYNNQHSVTENKGVR